MTLNVGVIGVGFGRQVHVPAFRLDPRCRIKAVCAARRERAEEAAGALKVPDFHQDWRALLDDPDISIIALAVPPAVQPEIASAAVAKGKHVFCEKPLGGGEAAALKLARMADKQGTAHMIDFEFAELDTWRQARELLAGAALGPLRQVVVSWHLETYAHRHRLDSWKTRSVEGGGTLNAFASHTFYYLEWLLEPVAQLAAFLHPGEKGSLPERDALNALWLRTKSGVPVVVSIGANSYLGHGHRLEFYGEQGTLVLENPTRDYINGFVLKMGARNRESLETIREDRPDAATTDGRIWAVGRLVRRFLDWVEQGARQSPSLTEAARVERLLAVAREAHRTGAWQNV